MAIRRSRTVLGDAYRALKEPLKFGNEKQIEAARLITSIQDAISVVKQVDTLEAREAFDDWYMKNRVAWIDELT